MQAFYDVKTCGTESESTVKGGAVRNYFLAAEETQWNYAPSGTNLISGVSLTDLDRWVDTLRNDESLRVHKSNVPVFWGCFFLLLLS